MIDWLLKPEQPEHPVNLEPVLGWRLWRVRDTARLHSWGVRHEWEPGVNEATCMGSRHFHTSPGESCNCGFWALNSPKRCIRYARDTITDRSSVVGLVRGWGQVALHGKEGFRAQYASPVCLFSNWLWDQPQLRSVSELGWWGRVQRALNLTEAPMAPARTRAALLRQTAEAYAVPLLSFQDAIRSGFLAEQGVGPRTVGELRRLTGGRSDGPLPQLRPGPAT